MIAFLHAFAAMLVGHALADFPLQGDFLARSKSPQLTVADAMASYHDRTWRRPTPWTWCMGAHCAIHAGAVWFLTGSLLLGVGEFCMHWSIDLAKCRRKITFGEDQLLHLLCKALWALAVVLL